MSDKLLNVLFLCDSNSSLSIFGEAILNRLGMGRFRGFSAGPRPSEAIDAMTVYQLERNNYDPSMLTVNDCNEYAHADAPVMDFVITLSGGVGASCSGLPGRSMVAHCHIDDPIVVEGTETRRKTAFARALAELEGRIS